MNLTALSAAIPSKVLQEIDMIKDCNSDIRLAHFLSQCQHESNNFTSIYENLNYSESGLLRMFPRYFTTAIAPMYAKKTEKIANRIYANRMGNGDESSGDGWKYRGRGYIQLTGKENYWRFSQAIKENCIANPELVAIKYPLSSAGYFFTSNHLWSICDKGSADVVVSELTKRINGGYIGLDDRLIKFKALSRLLGL